MIGLHDHGGNKYFGWRKIAGISDRLHPMMKSHRDDYYGGVSWANELARGGYAVLVHDAFAFGSRRVRVGDVPAVVRKDLREVNPESEDEIKAYNKFAGEHENLMAKSLFCAGRPGRASSRPRISAPWTTCVRARTSIRPASAAPASPAAGCGRATSPGWMIGSDAPAASA